MVQFLAHHNDATVNPLLSTLGAYLFQTILNFFLKVDTEGLFEMAGGGSLFDLAETMVSILHKSYNKKPFWTHNSLTFSNFY